MLIRTRDELATTLERRIISGTLPAGQLLPSERLLAEEYGLSRSMVREALRTLAERRLIDVVPGRGSFVRPASVGDSAVRLIDVFDQRQITPRYLIEARSMVETTAASLAAERADAAEIRAIGVALTAFDAATTLRDRVRGDLAFHLAIVRAAGNPLVETVFQAIQPYTVEVMLRIMTDGVGTADSVPCHRLILDGIRERAPERASDAMLAHLSVDSTAFGHDIDQNLDVITRQSIGRLSGSGVTLDQLLRVSLGTS